MRDEGDEWSWLAGYWAEFTLVEHALKLELRHEGLGV